MGDPAYKDRLLADASKAIAELGYIGQQGGTWSWSRIRPQSIIWSCALCALVTPPTLGLPPYGTNVYRSRVVIDPRSVLNEFGVDIPDDVEVRVWDSTAEIRYLVLPERPADTDGLSEDALAALVTRDSMIGTGKALRPGGAKP